ncbi:MAG TPA: hypothetical protein ENJ08_01200 [Gammaproteobacteria bacterium]|nr:hypothetical protein [Gammaproteobacteria bacterium]
MKRLLSPTLLLILSVFNTSGLAGPLVKLCLESTCKNPTGIEISTAAWINIKDLYASPFPSDKDEQDNIASAISIMESDLYYTLASQLSHGDKSRSKSAIKELSKDLFHSNTTENNYRNIKKYLGVLMDNYLVTRHFMRKKLTQTDWSGLTSSAIMLQSLQSSQLYVLQINNTDLGASPVISPYRRGHKIFNNPGTELSNENDDFE